MKNLIIKMSDFLKEGFDQFKSIKNRKTFLKQIPNLLTLLRLIILPVIIILFYSGAYIIAGLLTISSLFTDLLDGVIARKFDAITKFGAKFDAVADKIFTMTIMLLLFKIDTIILVPIILEIVIGLINIYYSKTSKVETSIYGKIKAIFLYALVCSLFFSSYNINILIYILFVITVITQNIAAISYIFKYEKKA